MTAVASVAAMVDRSVVELVVSMAEMLVVWLVDEMVVMLE